MNYFKQLYQYITKSRAKPKTASSDECLKFSELIENIQKNVVNANQSLEGIGLKYIEKFFEQDVSVNEKKNLIEQCDFIEQALSTSDVTASKQALQKLRQSINDAAQNTQGNGFTYRPKMAAFKMPICQNGVWSNELMEIPLFALSPVPNLKVKELTFSSVFEYVKNEGDDIYVRFLPQVNDDLHQEQAVPSDKGTQVSIAFSPEQSVKELKDVIAHYQHLLGKQVLSKQ